MPPLATVPPFHAHPRRSRAYKRFRVDGLLLLLLLLLFSAESSAVRVYSSTYI